MNFGKKIFGFKESLKVEVGTQGKQMPLKDAEFIIRLDQAEEDVKQKGWSLKRKKTDQEPSAMGYHGDIFFVYDEKSAYTDIWVEPSQEKMWHTKNYTYVTRDGKKIQYKNTRQSEGHATLLEALDSKEQHETFEGERRDIDPWAIY